MNNNYQTELPLRPYRVLDLTEGGSMIAGKLMGDLGADVIKIEPPKGSPSRIGPFYKDIPDPEKSLFWFAYNNNKRGITLDIGKADGRELFKKLASKADVILESFDPGYLDRLGLGYSAISEIKPDIIFTAITPFGQTGPKANFKAADLSIVASSSFLYLNGDPDRPPVWVSFPQASLHGGTEAVVGTMFALYYRQNTGEGQFVDVSAQEAQIGSSFNAPEMWDLNHIDFARVGGAMNSGSHGVRQQQIYPCKDGYILLLLQGGVQPFINSQISLIKWMTEENAAEPWLKQLDWRVDYNGLTITQDFVNRVEATISNFIITKTKKELYEEGALRRGILIAPVCNSKEVSENVQLQARNYWTQMEHPELGTSLTYCGPIVKLGLTPIQYRRRAPLIGEHNQEIYTELGISGNEMRMFAESGVI